MLYEIDQRQKWLDGALNAIGFLSRKRENKINVEADHWALLATAKLLKSYDKSSKSITKKEIIEHAEKICKSILQTRVIHDKYSELYGCLTNDYRTTPTATRVEGLLAALTFLPKENKILIEQIREAIDESILFLVRSQIKNGEYSGGIPRESLPTSKEAGSSREYSKRMTEIRIDYVQHTLSAMMQYVELGLAQK